MNNNQEEKARGRKRTLTRTLVKILFVLACVGLVVAAYLYVFPAYMTSQVVGSWCLKITDAESYGESQSHWSLTASIPFTVDDNGSLKGVGKYTFVPSQGDSNFVYTYGKFEMLGIYNPIKNQFEIDFGSIPLMQDYTISSDDELKRAMTASRLPIISSAWYWKAVNIQAKDGAYLGHPPLGRTTQGWSMTIYKDSCK